MKRRFLSLFACLMALAVVFSAGSAVLADDAPIVEPNKVLQFYP